MLLAITLLLTIIAPGFLSMADNTDSEISEDVIITPEENPTTEENPTPEENQTNEQDQTNTQYPNNAQNTTNEATEPEAGKVVTGANAGMYLPTGVMKTASTSDIYEVYEGEYPDGTLISSHQHLADAVTACGTSGTWTIVAMEDDDNVTDTGNINKQVVIPDGVTITLTSADGTLHTLEEFSTRHITVYGELILEKIILDGGGKSGGLIVENGTLIINEGAVVQNCHTIGSGGGIDASGSDLILNGGKITSNYASVRGGGVYASASTLTMTGGSITDNKAELNGGGLAVFGSSFLMENGSIDKNKATFNGVVVNGGGGVYLSHEGNTNSVFTMTGGTISKNEAYYGGGIYAAAGTSTANSSVTINGGLITENKTTGISSSGGGLYLGKYAQFDLSEEGTLNKNQATSDGGGVYASGSTIDISGGYILDNKATRNGGGVFLVNESEFTMGGGSITGNIAGSGGGVYAYDNSTATMSCGSISENRAVNGGAVHVLSDSNFTMSGGTISGNNAAYGGGVYIFNGGTFTMLDALDPAPQIIGNVAGVAGGGIYTSDYARLRIEPKAKIGGAGSDANKAATSSNLYKTEPEYIAVAQTPFISPVGVYSTWGQFYSTDTDHPLNNYDINPVGSLYRYHVYEDDVLITTKKYLADAVAACVTTGAWTIKATEDDDNVSDKSTKGVGIPAGITIKLTSDGPPRTLKEFYSRHITVYGNLTLENIILDGAESGGGLSVVNGTLNINNGAGIQNCFSIYNGGGINVSGGTLILNSGEITGNIAENNGGGVYLSNGSDFTMTGGSITSNQAKYNGGGVAVVGSSFIMGGGLIYNNVTTSSISNSITGGGGVYLSHGGNRKGVFTMNGGTILKNKAYEYGGGIYAGKGTGTAINSSITMNGGFITENTTTRSSGRGGGVALSDYAEFFLINGGTIDNNESTGIGGGVFADAAVFTMEKGSITGNKANNYGSGVHMVTKSSFTMSGGNIENNIITSNSSGYGGGVYLSGECKFTMSGGEIKNNIITAYSGSYGGGVYLASTSGIMSGGSITGNTAPYSGGGVYINAGTEFTLKGGGIIENNNARLGGGVEVDITATFKMAGGTIKGNTAGVDGGGILLRRVMSYTQLGLATLIMTDGTISGNTAVSGSGGGVHISDGSVFSMSGGSITGNKANDGGGVSSAASIHPYLPSHPFTMTGGSITLNEAERDGGGIYLRYSLDFTMSGASITDNKTKRNGGGVFLANGIDFTMTDGTILENTAGASGGGIYVEAGSSYPGNTYYSSVKITSGSITKNKAIGSSSSYGGGIYLGNLSKFDLTEEGTINENEAINGGGVYASGSTIAIDDGYILDNKATGAGGGMYVISCNTTVSSGTISGNEAANGTGGGIYTDSYENFSISSNVDFGRAGEPSANIASESSDWYPEKPIFETAFQTRFTSPVGIYTKWGEHYSTSANHPVNDFDINVIMHQVYVYNRDDNSHPNSLTADPPDSTTYKIYQIGEGTPFNLEGTDIPVIKNYPLIGWAEDSVSPPFNTTPIYISSVTSNKYIYLIYQTKTSLMVSNAVEGPYALKNKRFEFTVYLTDRYGALLQGTKMFDTIITTPGQTLTAIPGKLTLDQNGSATFNLKHGQQIEILDVSLDYKLRIVQTIAADYDAFYTDYKDDINPDAEEESNDTGISKLNPANPALRQMSINRKILFKNKMRPISDTGMESRILDLFGLTMLVGTGGLAYAINAFMARKQKRRLVWKRLIEHYEENEEKL